MSRLSLLLYTLLVYLLRLPLLLSFIWRSQADPAYRRRFAERFAWQPVPARAAGGIVVHAVSMGEVVAASPLIEKLLRQYPDLPLTVTCSTPAGSARIQAMFAGQVHHCYLPFDTPGANRRFFDKLAPQLLVLLETELWPNLIRQAHRRQIPVALVNARLSAKSARGYRRFHWLVQPMLQQLSLVLTQEPATARRYRVLAQGQMPTANSVSNSASNSGSNSAPIIHSCGNLKFDMPAQPALQQQAAALRQQWGLRPVWVAGSTHAGEDEVLLQAFAEVLRVQPTALLILVPRHTDRFAAVAQLVKTAGLTLARRSLQQQVSGQTQVLLGDTMGELLLWYQLADLVFIGGSLIPRGGHNPLEPMSVQKAMQSGPHVFNFAQVFQWLDQAAAVEFCADAAALAKSTIRLLQQPEERLQLAQRGHQVYLQHSGATTRITALLQPLMAAAGQGCRLLREPGRDIWYDPAKLLAGGFSAPSQALFRPHSWLQLDAVIGQSSGRNTVWFVKSNRQCWVLRHYYRGGLVGKLNKDWFWPVPLQQSRAMAEFRLLQQMTDQQLPVPAPVAALYQPSLLGYRADILLELIVGSTDLAKLLRTRALTAMQWQQVGQLVLQFHQAQIYHSDLNCHNILLDPVGKFWLIDFDKCGRRAGTDWYDETLARLQRSLRKEATLAAAAGQAWHQQAQDWQQLMQGYQQAKARCQ